MSIAEDVVDIIIGKCSRLLWMSTTNFVSTNLGLPKRITYATKLTDFCSADRAAFKLKHFRKRHHRGFKITLRACSQYRVPNNLYSDFSIQRSKLFITRSTVVQKN
jgi:hypothetical protein